MPPPAPPCTDDGSGGLCTPCCHVCRTPPAPGTSPELLLEVNRNASALASDSVLGGVGVLEDGWMMLGILVGGIVVVGGGAGMVWCTEDMWCMVGMRVGGWAPLMGCPLLPLGGDCCGGSGGGCNGGGCNGGGCNGGCNE